MVLSCGGQTRHSFRLTQVRSLDALVMDKSGKRLRSGHGRLNFYKPFCCQLQRKLRGAFGIFDYGQFSLPLVLRGMMIAAGLGTAEPAICHEMQSHSVEVEFSLQ